MSFNFDTEYSPPHLEMPMLPHSPKLSYDSSEFSSSLPSRKSNLLKRQYQRTDPIRKITPPSDNEQLSMNQDLSPYNKAHTYLENYKIWRSGSYVSNYEDFERPLLIKMPKKDWITLTKEICYEEQNESYPRLSYNTVTNILIIQCMSSPVHESIIFTFTRYIERAIPEAYLNDIEWRTNEKRRGFIGRYEGSQKIPDLLVENVNTGEIKWILEVGFSEASKELFETMKVWIEGSLTVKKVILIKVEESPRYKCKAEKDIIEKGFETLGFPKTESEILINDFNFENEYDYGPIEYNGYTWVGKISQVSFEIWKRNSAGKAEIENHPIDLLSPTDIDQVSIKLSDLIDIDPENDKSIFFDWEYFRQHRFKLSMKKLAVLRCQQMYGYIKKRMDMDFQDPDYELSN